MENLNKLLNAEKTTPSVVYNNFNFRNNNRLIKDEEFFKLQKEIRNRKLCFWTILIGSSTGAFALVKNKNLHFGIGTLGLLTALYVSKSTLFNTKYNLPIDNIYNSNVLEELLRYNGVKSSLNSCIDNSSQDVWTSHINATKNIYK